MAKSGKKRSEAGSHGFGKPVSVSTQNATKFMRKARQVIKKAEGDREKVYGFFKANLDELDESLLEALPSVFAKVTANERRQKRERITALFVDFGSLIQQFPLGDRALNLELAITVYQLALRVFLREESPENWAIIQNDLGIAYSNRIRGERAGNLEKAIVAYKLALQVVTQETFPEHWASVQNNLGESYRNRIRSERAENLEEAISAYELALQVRTRGALPENWATTQNNLGVAYRDRIRGERAENLEKAIAAYELALQVRTREEFPEYWADTQNNLGIAYHDRIRGERAENLEKAIAAYELALQVRTREEFPEYWAAIQNNLGNAYSDHIQGNQTHNVEQAIALHNQASEVFTRESFPDKWAENQSRLAESLMKRSSLTKSLTDLDKAVELLRDAIEVATLNSPHFIDAQHQLGNALSRRYENSQEPHDLEEALRAYETALNAISPEHYDRSKIWQALPTTQAILGKRLVRDGEWQDGLQFLLNSVSQLSTGDDALAHASALFETGRAHDALSDWDNARLYFRDALRLYEHLQDPLGVAKSRAELGSVLVSQGYAEKGMAELAKARDAYHQLEQPKQVAEVDRFYQIAQQVLERQTAEAYV